MADLLSVCIKEEQHSSIWFLWSEVVSGASFHHRLSAQYRNSVLMQRSVYERIYNSEIVAQVLHMMKEPDACPRLQMRTTLIC
jgi:hypothetical protein